MSYARTLGAFWGDCSTVPSDPAGIVQWSTACVPRMVRQAQNEYLNAFNELPEVEQLEILKAWKASGMYVPEPGQPLYDDDGGAVSTLTAAAPWVLGIGLGLALLRRPRRRARR